MIFNDRVNVTVKEKRFVSGTQSTVVVFDGCVPGIVTFLDSSSEGHRPSARLKIFLSPFAYDLPPMPSPELLILAWKQFLHLSVDGIVEPHYVNSRLHHYEILAKAV